MKWTLFVLFSLLCFGFTSKQTQTLNCNSLKIEVETKDASGANGEIILTVSGGNSPYKYVVYKSSGHLLSEDFSQHKFTALTADTYQAIVVDENGCKNNLKFN